MCDPSDIFDDDDPEAFPFIGDPEEVEAPMWGYNADMAFGLAEGGE